MNYIHVLISAENRKEVDKIIDVLLEKRLIAGSLITKGPSKLWWKGKIVELTYFNISAFTINKHKKAIAEEVKKISKEEVPIIAFFDMEGNKEFLSWIDENIA